MTRLSRILLPLFFLLLASGLVSPSTTKPTVPKSTKRKPTVRKSPVHKFIMHTPTVRKPTVRKTPVRKPPLTRDEALSLFPPPPLPPAVSIQRILQWVIDTKGVTLAPDSLYTEALTANAHALPALLAIMRAKNDKMRDKKPKPFFWEGIHKASNNMLNWIKQGPPPWAPMVKMDQRKQHWFQLYDPSIKKRATFNPSMDIEKVCSDLTNIPTLLHRFEHVIGYSMVLSIQNVLDILDLKSGPTQPNPMVMKSKEVNLQLTCLHYGLDQIRNTFLGGAASIPNSILDLAERTIREATTHMGTSDATALALEEDAAWFPIQWTHKDPPLLVEVIDSLDPEGILDRETVWKRTQHLPILNVARELQKIFKRLLDKVKVSDTQTAHILYSRLFSATRHEDHIWKMIGYTNFGHKH